MSNLDRRQARPQGAPTPDQREAFLEKFAQGWSVTKAAAHAGKNRNRFYELANGRYRDGKLMTPADDEFRAAFHEAEQSAKDVIRDEVHRRGIDGWEEPVFQGGKEVGRVRKYSDTLLMRLAQARIPEEYGEKHAITVGGQVEVTQGDITAAIDRFTAAVVHLASRNGATEAALGAGRGDDREPGIRVAALERET